MIKPKIVCSCSPYFCFVRFDDKMLGLEKALDRFFYEYLEVSKVRDIIEEIIEKVVNKDYETSPAE